MWTIPGDPPALFIDVPKTASKSTAVLFRARYVPPKARYGHAPVRYLLRGSHPVRLAEHFSFAFVRNPWDRMVSLFHYYRDQKESLPKGMDFAAFCGDFNLQWWRDRRPVSPPGWWRASAEPDPPLNKLPQLAWLVDDQGNLLVDKVYRFEALRDGWRDLVRRGYRANLDDPPWRNRSAQRRLLQDYYTPELVDRVAELFAPDIEEFGYTFEECT